jgi:hypothetical protein
MSTMPPTEPQPDTGPIEQPQPIVPPAELPPMPDDVDNPAAKEVRSNA